MEETQIAIDAGSIEPFWFTSTEPNPNRVLLFGVSREAPVSAESLAPFERTFETSERGVVFGPDGLDEVMAFPLHTQAVKKYFEERGVTGSHDFASV